MYFIVCVFPSSFLCVHVHVCMCKCSVFHPLFCMSVYVHVHVCMCKCSQCMCMYMFACVNVLTVILTYNIHTNNNSPTLHQQLTLACARRAHSRTSTYFNWQIVCKACISSAMRVSESVLLQKLLAQTAGKNEDKEGFQTDIQRPPALPTNRKGWCALRALACSSSSPWP